MRQFLDHEFALWICDALLCRRCTVRTVVWEDGGGNPAYPKVDSTITIRQLLWHTSGLFMFWENQKLWDDLVRYRDSVFVPPRPS